MKRIVLWSVVAITLLAATNMPVYADDTAPPDTLEQQQQQRDECLLLAKKCGNSAVSIQDKIERLKEEIAKGRTVYSTEELNNLKQKLDEVNRTLDYLLEQ